MHVRGDDQFRRIKSAARARPARAARHIFIDD
jgi:hypothetical protein